MNYYPRYPGDYMRKTMHLSMLEDGAYTRLLDWYYANDKPIPHERRHAVARATSAAERKAVDAVLAEFFVLIEGAHHNDRADAEIGAASKRIDAAKANGGKGGRPPKQKPNGEPDGNPVGFDLHNPTANPAPNPDPNRIESSLTPEEKEISEANASSSPAAAVDRRTKTIPDCPHEQIRRLYAEVLPSLPKAKLWSNDRQSALRQRWGEVARLKGWKTPDEGVEWFRRFFEAVSADDWLMGRSGRSAGHEGWECTIDYLLSPKGFRRVFEGAGRAKEPA